MSSIVDKYFMALDAKQKQLAIYVDRQISTIGLPERIDAPTQPKASGNYSLPIAIAGGGILIAGLVFDKTLVSVVGGLALVGGACAKMLQVRSEKQTVLPAEPKYYLLTKKVYDTASAIQQHLFDEWNELLSANKSKLKAEINGTKLDEQQKNATIQVILNTSVIDIPMMTVSSELSAVEKQKSIDAYRQYLQTFKSRCLAAIDKAVAEQKTIYAKIDGILGD